MVDLNRDLLCDALAYADKWLVEQQRLKEIPAISFAVRLGDELLISRAYGNADVEAETPATVDHIFRVASHSKWFTATAIMQLRERGKLRLDDPLGAYIPWLSPTIGAVTIRQVLNHAAGITRDGYDNDHWQLEHPFPDQQQLRKLVEDGGEVLAPNRKLKYSNIGYSLLGLVVESAGGMPYNQFVQENIVDRLGLQSTGPETDSRARTRLVRGYTSRGALLPHLPLPDVETGAMSAATGFYSTAEDLTEFAAAHFFGNDTLIGDDAKREMQRPYWPVEDMDSYGLGMQVATIGERRMVGHSGGFPGHTTRTYLDPEDKLAISLLTSESGGQATVLVKSIVKLIDLALKQKPVENAEQLNRYIGRFGNFGGCVDVLRLGNQLFAISPGADDPAADADKLEVLSEDTLRLEEKEGYGSPGEDIRYVRDAEGSISKIIAAGSTQYPEDALPEFLRQRRIELAARVSD